MIKPYLMTGVAVIALACFSPIASAQSEQGAGQSGPKAEQRSGGSSMGAGESRGDRGARSAQGAESSKSSGDKGGKAADRSSKSGDDAKSGKKSAAETKGDNDRTKSAEQDRDKDKSKRADKNRDDDKAKRADKDRDQDKAKRADKDRDYDKAKRADKDRGEAGKQAGDRERMQNDMQKRAEDRDRDGKQRADRDGGGKLKFTSEQRTRFHDVVKKQNVRSEHVSVDVRIGTHLPRHVHLHELPPTFISFAPDYRRYRFAYIDDRYVIVDPASYEIVEVIDTGGGHARSGGQVASLELTDREKQIVLRHVDWDRRADLSIDLALGAEIPDRVELIDFGPAVVNEVPKLRGYSYVVMEKRVAIIDPKDRDVLLVIRD